MADERLRVLAIDDEPGINAAIKKAIEASGHDAVTTESVEEFRNALQSWRPSIIIIDINMPNCDGVEVLRHLASARCPAPIYVSSGLDGRTVDAVIRLGNERGLKMAGKLPKPVHLADLQRVLAEQATGEAAPLSVDLAKALKGNELYLEYQPKIDCKLNRITAVEALLRWRHPQRGNVPPNQIILAAEESELIDPLTDWVVSHAAQQMAAWHRQNLPIEVAVNISAQNMRDPAFPDRLAQLCRNHAASSASMILELTETNTIHDLIEMMDALTRLRVKGFKLSIDDFGTGCSSLVQLQRMPFCEMKIDRSFVTQMTVSRDCAVIVEIIIDLARKLSLRSVAEGVESQPVLDQLVRLGCDAAQGYHISPPIAAERIPDAVRGYPPARARAAA